MEMEKRKKGSRQGIRRRWMTNSLGVVLLIVLFAIAGFSVALGTYYYSTMSNNLRVKAEYVVEFFGDYSTQREYYQHVVSYVNSNFEGKDEVEMQFLGPNGAIRFSTFGLYAYSSPNTPDIAGALNAENPQTTPWTGRDPATGEHILAVSAPLLVGGRPVAAVRYVTSLRLVDRQLIIIIAISALAGFLILALVYFSNLYFVRSIVEPVAGITEIAKRISSGS